MLCLVQTLTHRDLAVGMASWTAAWEEAEAMAKFISDSGPVFYMSGAWKTMESLLEMKRIIFSTKFFFHIWTLMADWTSAAFR